MVLPGPHDDLTAAWYAAAPPPPPTPAKGAVHNKVAARASYAGPPSSQHQPQPQHYTNGKSENNNGLRTSSSSMSLSFDRRALGDDLPADCHAPEPERPVSRNAMARQRERERQRVRTNSAVGYENSNNDNGQPPYQQPQSQHGAHISPASGNSVAYPHSRRDSSPAAPGNWSTYAHHNTMSAASHSPNVAHHHATTPSLGQVPYGSPAQVSQNSAFSGAAQPETYQPQRAWTAPYPAATDMAHTHPAAINTMQAQHVHGPTGVMGVASPVAYQPPSTVVSQQATQYASPYHAAEPMYPVQSLMQAQQSHPQQWAAQQVQQPYPAQVQPATVPFPSSSMPPPPTPAQYATSPVAGGAGHSYGYGGPTAAVHQQQQQQQQAARPLPSPASRSSSQSSSVGTRASTSSLGSVSGTVRRSLPQPPMTGVSQPQQRCDSGPTTFTATAARTPATNYATVRSNADVPTSLGRHDSVRMAAEEIMSRGMPRRKPLPGAMSRSNGGAHANASRSDGSITDGSVVVGAPAHRSTPSSASYVNRGRAESSGCLEKEMRAMKLQNEDDGQSQHQHFSQQVRTPLGTVQPTSQPHAQQRNVPNGTPFVSVPASSDAHLPARATSPRPIRAAPAPAPEVTMGASSIDDALPQRPVSRGPKDERERRRSMDVSSTVAKAPPPQHRHTSSISVAPVILPVRSPPPNVQAPFPTIAFSDDVPSSQHNANNEGAFAVPSIVVPGEDAGPGIQVTGPPEICVSVSSVDDNDGGRAAAEEPTGTISISMSANNIAQRSTTSTAAAAPQHAVARANGRTPSTFVMPEPASAPSVGSGAACAACQKWISGRVVHAMSHAFHPDCFACSHCGEHLEHVAFYEHEGRPYCHFDFHELFSKRCFHCRTPIVDQRYITINDQELIGGGTADANVQERCYHETHFFCANCGDPFLDPKLAASAAGADTDVLAHIEDENGRVRYGGREFVVHKGYPYCEKCHVNLHKPRCKGCKRPIVDEEYLTALRAKWHVGCFCCQRCTKPIESDNFFVRDGHAYDEQCYRIKLRSEL